MKEEVSLSSDLLLNRLSEWGNTLMENFPKLIQNLGKAAEAFSAG